MTFNNHIRNRPEYWIRSLIALYHTFNLYIYIYTVYWAFWAYIWLDHVFSLIDDLALILFSLKYTHSMRVLNNIFFHFSVFFFNYLTNFLLRTVCLAFVWFRKILNAKNFLKLNWLYNIDSLINFSVYNFNSFFQYLTMMKNNNIIFLRPIYGGKYFFFYIR